MTATLLLVVALSSGVGAQARFGLDQAVQRRLGGSLLPWGTWSVNVVGSLLLGVLTAVGLAGRLDREVQAVLAVGFCGSFTTFSTWTFETVRLLEDGAWWEATLNVVLSLAGGLAAAAVGFAGARLLLP